jgi:hypothetical protein
MVEALEERIIPCVTAVCPECDRVSLISDGSTESMLGSIYMWQRLREWIDTRYEVGAVVVVGEEGGGAPAGAAVRRIGGPMEEVGGSQKRKSEGG